MAAWRVTYTPGEWLVLSGPTMLVVMLPAPARMSALVNTLWDDILGACSVDALVKVLAQYGVDGMPDFAAFFWDATGLHGMARGQLAVVDADSGHAVVSGSDVVTWREEPLGTSRHLRVGMQQVNEDEHLQLPLVVGAVMASAIHLSTDPESRVHFPEEGQHGILGSESVLEQPVEPPEEEQRAAEVVGLGDETEMEPFSEAPAPGDQESVSGAESDVDTDVEPEAPEETDLPTEPESDVDADREPEPAVDTDDPTGEPVAETDVATEPAVAPKSYNEDDIPIWSPPQEDMEDADPAVDGGGGLRFDADESDEPSSAVGLPPVAQPDPTPPIPAPASGPVVVPRTFQAGDEDDDGGTVFSSNLAATHKPAAEAEEQRQVLAVPCARGHANPPGSRGCRICSAPVDSANPRLINRPALAGVHSNRGEFADVHVAVVVGRAPDASKGPRGAHLMRVPSPSSDISRSHLIVTPRDWSVIVTDLDSTNGTTVIPVGEQSFVLANGESVQVDLGTVLDLGDGVSLRIEPPRG